MLTPLEERIVAELIDGGKSNKEIGNALCLSTYSVKVRLYTIMKKLPGVHNRVMLALWAERRNKKEETSENAVA